MTFVLRAIVVVRAGGVSCKDEHELISVCSKTSALVLNGLHAKKPSEVDCRTWADLDPALESSEYKVVGSVRLCLVGGRLCFALSLGGHVDVARAPRILAKDDSTSIFQKTGRRYPSETERGILVDLLSAITNTR